MLYFTRPVTINSFSLENMKLKMGHSLAKKKLKHQKISGLISLYSITEPHFLSNIFSVNLNSHLMLIFPQFFILHLFKSFSPVHTFSCLSRESFLENIFCSDHNISFSLVSRFSFLLNNLSQSLQQNEKTSL